MPSGPTLTGSGQPSPSTSIATRPAGDGQRVVDAGDASVVTVADGSVVAAAVSPAAAMEPESRRAEMPSSTSASPTPMAPSDANRATRDGATSSVGAGRSAANGS